MDQFGFQETMICPKCGYEGEQRTLEQNKRLWAMLTDVSRQVDWYGRRLSQWAWKDIFTASLKKQDVVPGIDGGFVVLGEHTSRMTKAQMSDLIELMNAFGANHKVSWTDPTEPPLSAYEQDAKQKLQREIK